MDFPLFCKTLSHPPVSSLHDWQNGCAGQILKHKYFMLTVPRKHGKSWLLIFLIQYAMTYLDVDVVLLGWTEERKKISEAVFNYAQFHDLLANSRRTSYSNFEFKNGASYQMFLITSKDMLGLHGKGNAKRELDPDTLNEFTPEFAEYLKDKYKSSDDEGRKLWIVIDDPIDITFRKERWKERLLERKFESTIYAIGPDKFVFCGTRKFEGDFFDYLQERLGHRLETYCKTPILEDGSLLCPERFTYPKLPTYKSDVRAGKDDLFEMREVMGEYSWGSEMDQDPHPVTGEVFDKVKYYSNNIRGIDYDYVLLSIDRATTTKDSSDFTGITLVGRNDQELVEVELPQFDFVEGRLIEDPNKTTIKRVPLIRALADYTRKCSLKELADWMEGAIPGWVDYYSHAHFEIKIEKQGGGDDLISLGRDAGYSWYSYVYPSEGIHQTGNKENRIRNRLVKPINCGYLQFSPLLVDSELVQEALSFPYSSHDDAIDSLATAIFELESNTQQGDSRGASVDSLAAYERKKKHRAFFDVSGVSGPKSRTMF